MEIQTHIIKKISNYLLLIFLFFKINLNAQKSLIKNGGFETLTTCPAFGNPLPLINWLNTSNSIGSGIRNNCNNNIISCWGIPNGCWGGDSCYQPANNGSSYLGLTFFCSNCIPEFRNYIQQKLTDSLRLNKKYYCEFYVNLADPVRYACNNISALFTNARVYQDTTNDPSGIILAQAQIFNYNNTIITDTQNWVKVSGILKAQGGEQYITLGNFKSNASTSFFISNTTYNSKEAGYYIDDVSVIPLDSFCLQADAGKDTTIKPNDSVFIGSYTNGIDTIKWYNAAGQVIDSVQPGFWVKPNATGSYRYIVEQTVNGCYSRDTVNVNVALPLQFISFSIFPSLGGVRGGFTTASEINVSHYLIQRSEDGRNFNETGRVNANNRSSNEYNFIDMNINEGLNYYRVVGVDRDGKKTYSEVKSVNINNKNGISVYPNPAKDVVNVVGNNIKEVKLINAIGQVVYQSNNITQHQIINTKQFTKGIYLLNIVTKNNTVLNEKLIIE